MTLAGRIWTIGRVAFFDWSLRPAFSHSPNPKQSSVPGRFRPRGSADIQDFWNAQKTGHKVSS
jgi:hypothetical protein